MLTCRFFQFQSVIEYRYYRNLQIYTAGLALRNYDQQSQSNLQKLKELSRALLVVAFHRHAALFYHAASKTD